jgi:hypothetical protein
MVFDVEKHEGNKQRFLVALYELTSTNELFLQSRIPGNACFYERDILNKAGLHDKPGFSRIISDLQNAELVQVWNFDKEKGNEVSLTDAGFGKAERFQYDKSWLAWRRKVVGAAKEKAKQGASALVQKIGIGIASYVAGVLTGAYAPTIIKMVKERLGIK